MLTLITEAVLWILPQDVRMVLMLIGVYVSVWLVISRMAKGGK